MNEYKASALLLERAKKSLAGGVSSEFRKYNHPHALFYQSAKGSTITDVDGNEYLDFTLSQGPMLIGHSHPYLLKRVNDYSSEGQLFAGQHILEIELAEKLQQHIPSAELMRFCLDGSEAVQTALRVARAKTGKPKFIRFEGHYHGWLDNVAWGISTPSAEDLGERNDPVCFPWGEGITKSSREDFIILPWNDLALLQKTIEAHHATIAAVITEPVMCNNGCILPKDGFLEGMRRLTTDNNIALIFDEVITGFRTAMGGAQEYFGITPDLSIFAKAMASGYPVSAIVGKKEWMQLLADGKVIQAGTMNASNPTIAAALATIEILEQENPYKKIYSLGQSLMKGLQEIAAKHDVPMLVQGMGPMFHTGFTHLQQVNDYRDVLQYDKAKLNTFVAGLHNRGIRIIGRGLWYISLAHTDEDISHTLSIAEEILSSMKN